MALRDYVALDLQPGSAWAAVRELAGQDEQAVQDTSTLTAIRLLDRLLVDDPTTDIRPGDAVHLTASDRDRLLAAVYVRTYGPRIESTVRCQVCGERFDMDFMPLDLLSALTDAAQAAEIIRHEDGTLELADGPRFRAPTGEDELAVWRLSPKEAQQQLIERCLYEGDLAENLDAVQAELDVVAPLLDLDLGARCAECGAEQLVHFELQGYLLGSLIAEHDRRLWEIHQLARAYGWSLHEILELPRSERRTYVALVEREAAQGRSRTR